MNNRAYIAMTLVVLTMARSSLATLKTEIVFVIDGSGGIEPCLFEFQKKALQAIVCGGACVSCNDANIPHNDDGLPGHENDPVYSVGVVRVAGVDTETVCHSGQPRMACRHKLFYCRSLGTE